MKCKQAPGCYQNQAAYLIHEGIWCHRPDAYVISSHGGANKLKSEARPLLLILDDDEELNALLKVYLSPFGWEILSTTRPEDALNLINKANPTLIILDVMLPGRDGFEI